jgi:hypothetical protein
VSVPKPGLFNAGWDGAASMIMYGTPQGRAVRDHIAIERDPPSPFLSNISLFI